MTKVADVARYILDKLCTEDKSITAWKLQKLVYYSQAWSLVWDERKLFEERIEAWADGPVCPELYKLHQGKLDLYPKNIEGDPTNLDNTAIETIDAVLGFYGDKSGSYLRALTHLERPWLETRGDTLPGHRSNAEISWSIMAEYYGGL